MGVTEYLSKVRGALRLRNMENFARIAQGLDGAPLKQVELDRQLLGYDQRCLEYSVVRNRYAGIFNAHFVASLPYALEEQCRMGAALLEYCLGMCATNQPYASVYTLGDGAGVLARTLAWMSQGKIRTLNCSPNIENQITFNENRPDGAHFFHDPFFDVETSSLSARGICDFSAGFDVIIEDTTFQMYGPERLEPLLLAKRNLKRNGIFILLEKLSQEVPAEFERREEQKDQEFKSRFFTAEQISHKRSSIVAEMNSQLVTLNQIREALESVFSYGLMTWNSGNFYVIIASDDPDAITNLCSSLVKPAIPDRYVHHKMPLVLFGSFPHAPAFRDYQNDLSNGES
jgi:hypothetical protein